MGAFDDLIPGKQKPSGVFDDLIPSAPQKSSVVRQLADVPVGLVGGVWSGEAWQAG
jgi:NAD(P)H-dependent flavin oxidoreductase YrpB (nitropropane dioxygenase family)